MEATSLTGRTLKAVWLFPSGPVHPAWVNEFTTRIIAYDAFLELADDVLLQLDACEVVLAKEKYPSLGLELRESSPAALHVLRPDGRGEIRLDPPPREASRLRDGRQPH